MSHEEATREAFPLQVSFGHHRMSKGSGTLCHTLFEPLPDTQIIRTTKHRSTDSQSIPYGVALLLLRTADFTEEILVQFSNGCMRGWINKLTY